MKNNINQIVDGFHIINFIIQFKFFLDFFLDFKFNLKFNQINLIFLKKNKIKSKNKFKKTLLRLQVFYLRILFHEKEPKYIESEWKIRRKHNS
jgi:hypothetical protein